LVKTFYLSCNTGINQP